MLFSDAPRGTSESLDFRVNALLALLIFVAGAAGILAWRIDGAIFHTILDTSVALTGALAAVLLWDVSVRTESSWPLFLAIAFTALAVGEFFHTVAALEWLDSTSRFGLSAAQWRAGTWGPTAHLLPIGVGAALLLRDRGRRTAWLLALGLILLEVALFALFQFVPRYTAPGLLGITRPTLVLVPVLWAAVGFGYWRFRAASEMAHAIALTAFLLVLAHGLMLYSRGPNDPVAMAAHFGKFVGDVLLLLNLIQIGATNTARRRIAERELVVLNRELEDRVGERTAQLQETNAGLTSEMDLHERTSAKLRTQFERINLLSQITRAIGERQDMQSIFQIVVRSLEDQLPADFVSICLYDPVEYALTVAHVGVRSAGLSRELEMRKHAHVAIDENGLSRCVRGELVYEPDIAEIAFPFPERLAKQGLRSLVIAPLIAENDVFGVLVVARLQECTFTSTDCEFLRQLSDHAALAAHQAQLHARLQAAYDDLRQTQQAILQQERLRALGQMASGIAHDINNAISPVALYTDSLIESEPNLSPRTRNYLDVVKRVTNDIAGTVGRLREFYREREPNSPHASVDLNSVAQQVVEFTRARWNDMPQERGIVIDARCALDPAAPHIMGVEHEIREALTNLVFNAVDALPQGGTIVVRTGSDERSSTKAGSTRTVQLLEVIDSGVGMDEATRLRCMEPFFTTKGERGTGLGLASVYGVAERHSADVEIDTVPGQGSTFRLTFPMPIEPLSEPGEAPLRLVRAPPMRLLVVDDDPFVLESMRVVLEIDGHTVTSASGGQEGIDAFQAALNGTLPFEAVFTDLGMPHVDGLQVARAIKQRAADMPVILLTGWGRRMKTADERAAHIDFFLSKPSQLEELREVLTQIATRVCNDDTALLTAN
ncbi:MAG: hybrid sensor histidine kinase/response regulator [Sphingomonas bacterium]|uniref:hybrid sensor histidine kinase/response regulator n=1 Tax=Sphingomonas bacterium TaxID=1895847 RepID=UPI002605392E|nr:response regulator [Sphingomonas bacterium]MDB5704189.1 hybrid sensor histidine kinase/response regulator [Sphingomonas bacterium]